MTIPNDYKKIRVMHVVHGLGIGGMETVLAKMLTLFDSSRFITSVCCMCLKGELAKELEKAGIKVYFMLKNNKFDFLRVLRLARLLKKEKIDIVHSYSGVYRDAAIAGKLAGVPVIIHTDQGRMYPDNFTSRFYHRIISNFIRHKVTCVSKDLKKYLIKAVKIKPSKISVIPNGVVINRSISRVDRIENRKKLGFSDKDLILGIIARLAPVKDHSALIEASAKVFKKIPDAKLLIIGDGPLRKDLESKVQNLNIADRVMFLGKRRDIPQLLSALDLFVLCSRHEGISLSSLEAMSLGVPVILTNVGGNPEIVENNKSGILVEPQDSNALAEAIVNLLNNPQKRLVLGENGRKRVIENFDLSIIVKRYEKLYSHYFSEPRKQINVLYLASNPEWAGAEVHIATLARSFKEDGRINVSACVFHDGKLVEFLRRHNISVTLIKLKWLFDLSAIFKISKILRDKRIDILHTHGYKANVIGALAKKLHRRTICIRTEHGLTEPFFGFGKLKMNFYEYLDFISCRFLTEKVIAVSSDIKNAKSKKYPEEKIITIQNGIDCSSYDAGNTKDLKRDLGIPEDTFIIGTVGRLSPVKGHVFFIKAAKRILNVRKDAHFIIVGEGPLREQLWHLCETENIKDKVTFTGFRNDIKDILKILDIVVFPSLSEGIPYALLEAMSEKKAIIATKVGGILEVISDGKNGILVNSESDSEIFQKCILLMNEADLRTDLGISARETIIQNFSVDKMKEKTLELYEACLPKL